MIHLPPKPNICWILIRVKTFLRCMQNSADPRHTPKKEEEKGHEIEACTTY